MPFFFNNGTNASTLCWINAARSPLDTFSFRFPVSAFRNSKICCSKRIKRLMLLIITLYLDSYAGASCFNSSTDAVNTVNGVNNSCVMFVDAIHYGAAYVFAWFGTLPNRCLLSEAHTPDKPTKFPKTEAKP